MGKTDFPIQNITKIEEFEKLRDLVIAWTDCDCQYLENYFKEGGRPYISFSNSLTAGYDNNVYYSLPSANIGISYRQEYIVPLPSLIARKGFFIHQNGVVAPDLDLENSYTKMLDIAKKHGCNVNDIDSCGISVLLSSLSYNNVFINLYNNSMMRERELCYISPNYDYGHYAHMLSNILIQQGADPFAGDNNIFYSIPIHEIAVLIKKFDAYYWDVDGQVITFKNYYTKLFLDICKTSFYRPTPLLSNVGRDILHYLIKAGVEFEQNRIITARSHSELSKLCDDRTTDILEILRLLFSKNILQQSSLGHNSVASPSSDDRSAMYILCSVVRQAIDEYFFVHEENSNKFMECLAYCNSLITVLQQYGADINEKEHHGISPAYGILESQYFKASKAPRVSKDIYECLVELLKVFIVHGWDCTETDDDGKTLFDYYPNKQEGRKAMKALMKIANQVEAEKAAYASIEEEFLR